MGFASMPDPVFDTLFDIRGRSILITGGSGVLGRAMAGGLLARGANVAILGRDVIRGDEAMAAFPDTPQSGRAMFVQGDVLDKTSFERSAEQVIGFYGKIDALVNGAGGNKPEATSTPEAPFFDLSPEALQTVVDLNLMGTIIPSQVIGRHMAQRGQGTIVNITSMTAYRPLTRVAAYSAAKAGIWNFTQWLATTMAMDYSPQIRVNALAPGFFQTNQNRYLLTDKETGSLTPRGQAILDHTPMGRFGTPDDLIGALVWLVSPASAFVTGIVVPVDGGFSAYSGV